MREERTEHIHTVRRRDHYYNALKSKYGVLFFFLHIHLNLPSSFDVSLLFALANVTCVTYKHIHEHSLDSFSLALLFYGVLSCGYDLSLPLPVTRPNQRFWVSFTGIHSLERELWLARSVDCDWPLQQQQQQRCLFNETEMFCRKQNSLMAVFFPSFSPFVSLSFSCTLLHALWHCCVVFFFFFALCLNSTIHIFLSPYLQTFQFIYLRCANTWTDSIRFISKKRIVVELRQ